MKHLLKYKKGSDSVKIDLCKSAPIQIKPIPIIEELSEYWKNKGHREIIDVGCGKLRNSLVLVNYFSLWICDFPEQLKSPSVKNRLGRLKKSPSFKGIIYPDDLKKGLLNVDAAFMCFVLNTIPEEQLRVQLIKDTMKNLKSPHEIFIAVPYGEKYYKNKTKEENQFNDGFLFNVGRGRKTFRRDYSAEQIDNFMAKLGFKVDRIFTADKKRLRIYLRKS
jgi:hypothetical protein